MSLPDDLATFIEHSPDHDWLDDAACGDLDLDDLDRFFVEAGHTLSKDVASMCGRCPVRERCLQHALDRELTGGYFGGTSPSKRRQLGSRATG